VENERLFRRMPIAFSRRLLRRRRVDIEQDGAIEMSAGCRTECRPPFSSR
jgi:hypothetical protein